MECSNCGHVNPVGAKFCNECGTPLENICSNCGHENPFGAKFCNECGTALGAAPPGADRQPSTPEAATPPPDRSDLHALIPDEFAARLASARAQQEMVGERRIVTMLFCDVKGSTAAAGKMDPEDWAQIINNVFEYMIRPVYKYEGTVARLMGDGILAFFGAPVAHEDDPQRAILAALGILSGFEPQKEKIRAEWGLEMNFRIGINTGLVMVGAVGSDLQMEYTALGDAINLAARMEQTAAPGTIQVAEDTYELAAPVFEWEALGRTEVRGKDEPVRTYRALGKKVDPGRLRGIAGLDAPMIGRRAELEKLLAAVHRLEQGSGGIAFITGEAGLGKSRLIQELKRRTFEADGSPEAQPERSALPDWSDSISRSYESTQPYALFQRLLRQVYGVRAGDSPVEMWEKFTPILELLPTGLADEGRVFEALFAAGGGGDGPQLEGETFKRQLLQLVLRLISSWTERAPQVLVLDDLHWSDPASIDLLIHLYRLTDSRPILLVCAMRPEREAPAWSALEAAIRDYPHRTTEISLRSLSPQDTDTLVDNLLLVADLPRDLRVRILEKTEGNPFFIEEVIRVLIDNGVVEREDHPDGVRWHARGDTTDIDIPDNLQSLLTARIDRLEEDARRTLQLASVIGRSFYYRVLDTISQTVARVRVELDQHLNRLQRAEMIRESARSPELEYAFRHALTQEAAYNTILVRERREFHRQAGEAIENLFSDRLEEFYPILSHHYGEARDPKAFRFAVRAGDAAFRLYAIPEAVSHYRRAARTIDRADRTGEEITHLYSRLGRCYELLSEHDRAVRTYEEMAALARRREDGAMELAALVSLGKVFAIPTPVQDVDKAEKISREGLELAGRMDDQKAESRLAWNFLLMRMYSGRMDAGIPYGEKSVDLARAHGMRKQLAHALQDLGIAYTAVGELEKARLVLDESLTLWDDLNNAPMLAENRTNMGLNRYLRGELQEAVSLFEESYQIADRIDNAWGKVTSRIFFSPILTALGEMDRALDAQSTWLPQAYNVGHPGSALIHVYRSQTYDSLGAHEQARASVEGALQDSITFPPFHKFALAVTARQRLADDDPEAAQDLLAEIAQLGEYKAVLQIDIDTIIARGEYALHKGDLKGAAAAVSSVLELIANTGSALFKQEALMLKSGLSLARGNLDEAARALAEAAELARRIGHRNLLWQILAKLARVEEDRGDMEAAGALRAEAAASAGFIAQNTGDADLRASFLRHIESHGISLERSEKENQ